MLQPHIYSTNQSLVFNQKLMSVKGFAAVNKHPTVLMKSFAFQRYMQTFSLFRV